MISKEIPSIYLDKAAIFLRVFFENQNERKISLLEAENIFGIQWLEWSDECLGIIAKLSVRWMGDKFGWGLFTAAPIAQGEIIGFFTGDVFFQGREISIASDHVFAIDVDENRYQMVDATHKGDITRFLQHLPSREMIENLEIDDSLKDEIASSNISKNLVQVGGFYTECYVASEPIDADVLIGCSYSPCFWLETKPAVFKKNGEEVNLSVHGQWSSISLN